MLERVRLKWDGRTLVLRREGEGIIHAACSLPCDQATRTN